MWSLFWGSTDSSEDMAATESKNKRDPVPKSRQDGKLDAVHAGGKKHRIPSPTREQGDGMEFPEDVKKMEVNFSKSGGTNVIVLPQTNIKLEKLPPITADKEIQLPDLTPTSPLVKVRRLTS